jgi:hypothetical protein
MTTRRRPNLDVATETAAWAEFFTSGHDWFDDLVPLGFDNQGYVNRADAAAAWLRLGSHYMEHIWPQMKLDQNRESPWALDQFGGP